MNLFKFIKVLLDEMAAEKAQRDKEWLKEKRKTPEGKAYLYKCFNKDFGTEEYI